MINLEPIAKSVQKRLFEKMRAVGRETSYSDSPTGVLTQQEMLTRTTFIKMWEKGLIYEANAHKKILRKQFDNFLSSLNFK